MDWQAVHVSLWLAGLTALLLLPLGVVLVRWLALTHACWRSLIEALLMLPLLLPPTVLEFYIFIAVRQASPVGSWLSKHLDIGFVFSFQGLLLASVLVNLPFMVQPIQRAFAGMPQSLREAAWVCSLSRWRTFFNI
jgi:molybdate transport system permease protein